MQSIRVVGNIGVGILTDPTFGSRQNDVLTYGVSFARALTSAGGGRRRAERAARRRDQAGALPGTESRGLMKFGGRYTAGTIRFDAGMRFGLTTVDPTVGFTLRLHLRLQRVQSAVVA